MLLLLLLLFALNSTRFFAFNVCQGIFDASKLAQTKKTEKKKHPRTRIIANCCCYSHNFCVYNAEKKETIEDWRSVNETKFFISIFTSFDTFSFLMSRVSSTHLVPLTQQSSTLFVHPIHRQRSIKKPCAIVKQTLTRFRDEAAKDETFNTIISGCSNRKILSVCDFPFPSQDPTIYHPNKICENFRKASTTDDVTLVRHKKAIKKKIESCLGGW